MIFPNKYVSYQNSYIFLSDKIVRILNDERVSSIESIWGVFKKTYPSVSFSKFYNSFILLYMLGLIESTDGGIHVNLKNS